MAESPPTPRAPSGIESLRAGIDAHRQLIEASKQAGAQVQADKLATSSRTESES